MPSGLTTEVYATEPNTVYTVECGEYSGAVETAMYFGVYDVELSGLEKVSIPTQSGTLTYTGSIQSPVWIGYDNEKMTIGGTTSSTNARTYTATFSLLASYVWEDGSTDSKSVTWTIGRAAVAVPAQSGVLTYTGSIQSPVWTGYDSEKMTIGGTTTSSDTSVATVSMSGTTVTVKSVASGSATITVSVSEGTNYTAPVNVTCSVTASEIPSFANATWEEISYASQNNLIPDTWLVGDEKDITLTTGETLTFQIYDFGHDLLADDNYPWHEKPHGRHEGNGQFRIECWQLFRQ